MHHDSASKTQHRSKRQFQASITEFFSYDDIDSGSGSGSSDDDHAHDASVAGPFSRSKHQHHAAAKRQHNPRQPQLQLPRRQFAKESLAPSVPGAVQADLLNVGMRVRKAIPEGYKTQKTAALPSIQTTLTMTTSSMGTSFATTTTETYSVQPAQDAIPGDVQHQRELLPFCGLQKIGGFAEQPVTNLHLYGGADAPLNIFPLPAAAFTQPFSSQSSTSSSVSNSSLRPTPTHAFKRSWVDEDDDTRPTQSHGSDFFFKLPVKVAEDEPPVSPLSESPPQSIAFPPIEKTALRPFAQPRTRRAGATTAIDVAGAALRKDGVGLGLDMDVENAESAAGGVVVGSPGDFDEADFLMGGV